VLHLPAHAQSASDNVHLVEKNDLTRLMSARPKCFLMAQTQDGKKRQPTFALALCLCQHHGPCPRGQAPAHAGPFQGLRGPGSQA